MTSRLALRPAAVLTFASAVAVNAATPPPKAFFQNATSVVAQDNRVNLNRVAVRDSAGVLKYFDIALVFNVAPNGSLTVNPTATKITASPVLSVGGFKPGTYLNNLGSFCEYTVGTPGSGGGARTVGTLTTTDSFCPYLDVSWVTGPIAGHPNQGILNAAGITFQGYSWGTVGEVGGTYLNLGWNQGDIVGVVQAGNVLTVHRYGDDNIVDSTVAFVYCPTCE